MSLEMTVPRVGVHEGTDRDFLDRYEHFARTMLMARPAQFKQFAGHLLEWIADERNLKIAWDFLSRQGGHAPGPNGRTFADYTRAHVWDWCRCQRDVLKSGRFEHGPLQKRKIPKRPGSNEKRTIWLANIEDRVVARAVKQVLEPLLDPKFDRHSFCRRRRGPLWAMAYAQTLTEREGRYVWIVEDVRHAFDRVPRSRLLDIVRHYLPCREICDLVDRLIVTDDDSHRGIPQGSPLSPLLLNLYLDHFLDRPWRRRYPTVPLLRYVDDLLLPCAKEDDVFAIYADLTGVLAGIGMLPKHGLKDAVIDIRQKTAGWLGYQVSAMGSVFRIRMAHESEGSEAGRARLDALYDRFVTLHAHPDAPLRAPEILEGIIEHAGPALPYSDTRRVYRNLMAVARRAAFEELPSYERILSRWEASHQRWQDIKTNRVATELMLQAGKR